MYVIAHALDDDDEERNDDKFIGLMQRLQVPESVYSPIVDMIARIHHIDDKFGMHGDAGKVDIWDSQN